MCKQQISLFSFKYITQRLLLRLIHFTLVDIFSFGYSPSAGGAWKNVLFWTPLWNIFSFMPEKLDGLKMFNTGWKGFRWAVCSFLSHRFIQAQPKTGKYTVWCGKKIVGLTGHRQDSMRVYVGGIFHLEMLFMCNIQCMLISPHKTSSVRSKKSCQHMRFFLESTWHRSKTLDCKVSVN